MSSLEQMLRRWREDGLLDEATCKRLAAYERQRRKARVTQPLLVELFAYLGLVIVGAGVVLLVGVNWEHLAGWARVSVLAVPGVAVLAIGGVLVVSGEPGMRRGGAMGWLLSLVLVTASVGVAADVVGTEPETAVLSAGIVALALSAVLWALKHTHVQVLGVAAAGLLLSIGATAFGASYFSEPNTLTLFGAAMVAQFAAGAALVRLGVFRPQPTAGILSLLGLALGTAYLSAGLAARFSDFYISIIAGAALLAFSLWGMVATRLGLLIPGLLGGTLSQVGYSAATVLLAVGVAGETGHDQGAIAGLILIGLAAAMVGLAESGVCSPRATARLAACVGCVAGAVAASAPGGPVTAELVPLLVGGGLVTLSVKRGTFLYMVSGLAAIFVGLVMPVARHVDDPTVAALLMIAIGLALLAVIGLLARYRPWAGGARRGPPVAGRHQPASP